MSEVLQFVVDEDFASMRLDVFLGEVVEDASRSYMKRIIKDKRVLVNGEVCTKPSRMMALEDTVSVDLPPLPTDRPQPEAIPLEVLYEDADLIIVNKPSGLVVHPAPGHETGTLVNAILHQCPDFEWPGRNEIRPGIVHRLDRDTSGVMVVAKRQAAFDSLAKQAADHSFDRQYLALVRGEFPEDQGRVVASIGRSLTDRSKMAVTQVRAKDAVTNFKVKERFGVASLVSLKLETGRTHQIRVHMRFAGRPVLGDPVYGVTDYGKWTIPEETLAALKALQGQALHAEMLGITHPTTGERLRFSAPAPDDFLHALDALRKLKAE